MAISLLKHKSIFYVKWVEAILLRKISWGTWPFYYVKLVEGDMAILLHKISRRGHGRFIVKTQKHFFKFNPLIKQDRCGPVSRLLKGTRL